MNILKGLEKSRQFWFAIFSIFLFFILRLPSLFEPLWYGDEGIYQVVGTSLNHGKLLYSQIFDNKPPLLYWLYAIFQSDQFSVRLASLIFGVLTVIMFFFLSKKLFKNTKSSNVPFLTTFIFVILFGLPILEGNIANAENFMLLPIIASAFLIVNPAPNRCWINQKKFFVSGLLLGIAFLFKIVAVFDLSAFIIFCFILNLNSLKKEIKSSTFFHGMLTSQANFWVPQKVLDKLFSVIVGFLLPLFLVSLLFLINGTFIDFVKAAFLANISYVSYGNAIGNFPFLLLIKLLILGAFLLFTLMKRTKLNKATLFISIWFAFSLFNAYFSQRPYTHYLLVLIPSLSLVAGLILFNNKYRKIITFVFLVALLIIVKGFGIPKFNKIPNYYQNFISYAMGKETMVSYQAFFDSNTPLDYEIARFIKPQLTKNDTIFVWGNNAQLYQLVGVVAPTKYIVAYHITNYKDGLISTQAAIQKIKPKFIVAMADTNPIPFPLINYFIKININSAAIYERIF